MGDNPFETATPFLERMAGTGGLVRIEQIMRQITTTIETPQRIIDIGCGAGVVTCKLLQHYPHSTAVLVDPSEEMIRNAIMTATSTSVSSRCSFAVDTLAEALTAEYHGNGDLVVCHAVLNWLVEPMACLETLVKSIPAGKTLSLVVGSRYGHVLEALSRGHIADVSRVLETGIIRSESYPDQTLFLFDPHEAKATIVRCSGRILLSAGIRVATDLIPDLQPYSLEKLSTLEAHVEAHPRLWYLGDLTHFIIRKE